MADSAARDDEIRLQEEVRRSRRAREILEDPDIKLALDDMERAVVDKIAACPPVENVAQQKLCMLLSVTRLFRQVFQSHLETGKMAAFQLEEKKRRGSPPKVN